MNTVTYERDGDNLRLGLARLAEKGFLSTGTSGPYPTFVPHSAFRPVTPNCGRQSACYDKR